MDFVTQFIIFPTFIILYVWNIWLNYVSSTLNSNLHDY